MRIADSWRAVFGGMLVMMGVGALITPILSAYLGRGDVDLASPWSAVPVLVGLVVAALIGGYAAGRIAMRRTGWHGLLSGLLGLFITGGYLIAGVAVQKSFLGIDNRDLGPVFPMVFQVGLYHSYPALTLGLVVGFPARILAAWIGGLVARPRHAIDIKRELVEAEPAVDRGQASHAPKPL